MESCSVPATTWLRPVLFPGLGPWSRSRHSCLHHDLLHVTEASFQTRATVLLWKQNRRRSAPSRAPSVERLEAKIRKRVTDICKSKKKKTFSAPTVKHYSEVV